MCTLIVVINIFEVMIRCALTHLDMGDEALAEWNAEYGGEQDPLTMDLSDQGARAPGSLVRLTHLDIRGVGLNDEEANALSSLTVLTCLVLSFSTVSNEGVKALAAATFGVHCSR
jgi:hypothetical protein